VSGAAERVPKVHGAVANGEAEAPFDGVTRIAGQAERSTITAYAFEPGGEFPIHAHPEEQITVVLEGTVVFTVEGERHELGAGETFVVGSELEHGLRAGPDGARFLAVIVPRRERPDAYRILGGSPE
jgi:quercetin dioxygenase-like cupin family protein